MKWKSAVLILPLVLLAHRPAAAVETEEARLLVRSAVNDTLVAFAGKVQTPDEAQMAIKTILGRYSDMETVSQRLLGRYWNRSAAEPRLEFSTLLERFFITAFGNMVRDISADERIEVRNAEVQGDHVVVHSTSLSPGEEPLAVDWVVVDTAAGKPVIVDLSVDGVTVVTTMQADFTAVIRSASGRLEALFEPLRRKVSTLGG